MDPGDWLTEEKEQRQLSEENREQENVTKDEPNTLESSNMQSNQPASQPTRQKSSANASEFGQSAKFMAFKIVYRLNVYLMAVLVVVMMVCGSSHSTTEFIYLEL